jgi:hypothetical protein
MATLSQLIHAKAIAIAKLAVRATTAAGSGHPTTALSLEHLIATLMYRTMRWRPEQPRDPGADRLVLSEGHAVPIVYAACADLGATFGPEGQAKRMTVDDFMTSRQIDSPLDGHRNPALGFPFFDAATGSLGQGLSVAGGLPTGTTAAHGRGAASFALPATLAFVAVVSIWTPFVHPSIAERWFSWPNIGYLSPVPIVTTLVAYGIWRSLLGPLDRRPFLLAIALFLLAFFGLGVSLWPYAVPCSATLWQAASSPPTLAFVGVGTAVIVPIVLGYFGFAHWVFRGKTTADIGYE